MRELIDFTLYVLQAMVDAWFGLDLGSYSFGDFMVALLVISVFISSLVISFRSYGDPAKEVNSIGRPKRKYRGSRAGKKKP